MSKVKRRAKVSMRPAGSTILKPTEIQTYMTQIGCVDGVDGLSARDNARALRRAQEQ